MQIFPFRCKLDRLLEAKAHLGCFCTRQIVCESLQNLRLSVLIFRIPQARNLGWSLDCSVFWFSVCLSWILLFYILWLLLYVCVFLYLNCLAQRQRYLPEKSSPDLLFNILSFAILIDSSKVRGPWNHLEPVSDFKVGRELSKQEWKRCILKWSNFKCQWLGLPVCCYYISLSVLTRLRQITKAYIYVYSLTGNHHSW